MISSKEILTKPRTGAEVQNATFSHPPIYLYSELDKMAAKRRSVDVLRKMMKRNKDSIILVQDPKNMHSGHWTSLSFIPEKKKAYFFSSYGGKPDVEKNEWIPNDALEQSNQAINVINDGLKYLAKHGWEVHYSQYPYQKAGDNTATCGIWCTAFMNSGLNPDEFHELVKYGGYTPEFFYQLYFV